MTANSGVDKEKRQGWGREVPGGGVDPTITRWGKREAAQDLLKTTRRLMYIRNQVRINSLFLQHRVETTEGAETKPFA